MTTTTQPARTPRPSLRERVRQAKEKVSTRHGWLGDYDYAWLCTPALPCLPGSSRRRSVQPPFYALDQELPLVLAISTGLQHSLAMLAGACPFLRRRVWLLMSTQG
jgi:hypothetical protein